MRALILLVVGCIAGAAATYALRAPDYGSAGALPSWLDRIGAPFSRRNEAPAASPGFTSRLAAFRSVAAVADAALLEATLERLAHESPSELSELSELEIDAALARLAELDPARAVGAGVRLELSERFVVRAYQSWARGDFVSAARRAVTLDPRRLRSAALIGLIDSSSEPELAVPRLLKLLPAAEGASFIVDWLERLAGDDPERAFREALALGEADTQERAILRIAEVWARQNPIAALSRVDALPGALAAEFREVVGGEWARRDPGGMLDYLSSFPGELEVVGAWRWLAAADPARALEVARVMSRDYGNALRSLAQRELINRDPDAMLAQVHAMPPGRERDDLLRELSSVYGRDDPQKALAWLESMSVATERDRTNALFLTVAADPSQLREALERLPPGQDVDRLADALLIDARGNAVSAADAAAFADLLLDWDDPRAESAVGSFLSGWIRDDNEAAIAWATASRAELNPRMLASMAQSFASQDPRAAAAQVERLPVEFRDEWIASIIAPYARSEPQAALEWLTRFRNQPVYERSLRVIVERAADRDPRALARLVAEASAELQIEAAPAVVAALSNLGEAEAVRWAQGLNDGRARQQAILTLVPRLARRNAAQARQLVDAYVADLAERQRAIGIIDRAAGR